MKLVISSTAKKILAALGLVGLLALTSVAFAQDSDLGTISTEITSKFAGVGRLFLAVSYVCGFGFALISIFKFKSHKDNPQQTALGVPVAFLCIGMALIFLPSVLSSSGKTVFGDDRMASSFTGDNYDVPLGSSS